MGFQIGDVVRANPNLPNSIFYGYVRRDDVGTVIAIEEDEMVGVAWGRYVGGHNCGCPNVQSGHATWVLADKLILVSTVEDVEIENVKLEGIL